MAEDFGNVVKALGKAIKKPTKGKASAVLAVQMTDTTGKVIKKDKRAAAVEIQREEKIQREEEVPVATGQPKFTFSSAVENLAKAGWKKIMEKAGASKIGKAISKARAGVEKVKGIVGIARGNGESRPDSRESGGEPAGARGTPAGLGGLDFSKENTEYLKEIAKGMTLLADPKKGIKSFHEKIGTGAGATEEERERIKREQKTNTLLEGILKAGGGGGGGLGLKKGAGMGGKGGGMVNAAKGLATMGKAAGKGIGAFIGGILKGIASGLSAFANPLVLAGLAAVTAALWLLEDSFEPIGKMVKLFGGALKEIFEGIATAVERFGAGLKLGLEGIAGVVDSIGGAIAGTIRAVGDSIANVIDKISSLKTAGTEATTKQIKALSEISGDRMIQTAKGITAMKAALEDFGGGTFSQISDSLFGGGGPIDKIIELAKKVPELMKAAEAIAVLGAAGSDFAKAESELKRRKKIAELRKDIANEADDLMVDKDYISAKQKQIEGLEGQAMPMGAPSNVAGKLAQMKYGLSEQGITRAIDNSRITAILSKVDAVKAAVDATSAAKKTPGAAAGSGVTAAATAATKLLPTPKPVTIPTIPTIPTVEMKGAVPARMLSKREKIQAAAKSQYQSAKVAKSDIQQRIDALGKPMTVVGRGPADNKIMGFKDPAKQAELKKLKESKFQEQKKVRGAAQAFAKAEGAGGTFKFGGKRTNKGDKRKIQLLLEHYTVGELQSLAPEQLTNGNYKTFRGNRFPLAALGFYEMWLKKRLEAVPKIEKPAETIDKAKKVAGKVSPPAAGAVVPTATKLLPTPKPITIPKPPVVGTKEVSKTSEAKMEYQKAGKEKAAAASAITEFRATQKAAGSKKISGRYSYGSYGKKFEDPKIQEELDKLLAVRRGAEKRQDRAGRKFAKIRDKVTKTEFGTLRGSDKEESDNNKIRALLRMGIITKKDLGKFSRQVRLGAYDVLLKKELEREEETPATEVAAGAAKPIIPPKVDPAALDKAPGAAVPTTAPTMKKVPVPAVPTAAPTMKKAAKRSAIRPDRTADDPYAHMKSSLREYWRQKDARKAKIDQQAGGKRPPRQFTATKSELNVMAQKHIGKDYEMLSPMLQKEVRRRMKVQKRREQGPNYAGAVDFSGKRAGPVTKVVNTRPSEQIAQAGLERDARATGPATPPPAPPVNVVNAPTTTNYVGQAGIAARRPIALSQRVKDF